MIATLRWQLVAVPGRLIRHAHHLVLRLPPPGRWHVRYQEFRRTKIIYGGRGSAHRAIRGNWA
jgi:hypothetical protein